MTGADKAEDRGLTTEQIAAVGTEAQQGASAGGQQGVGTGSQAQPGVQAQPDMQAGQPAEHPQGDRDIIVVPAGGGDGMENGIGDSPGENDRFPSEDAVAAEDVVANAVAADAVVGNAVGEDAVGAADLGTPGAAKEGSFPADAQPRARLLKADELQSVVMRWKEIQADFVDEPRRAVRDADALVAELMQRLAQVFASERAELEKGWSRGDEVSTEELRQGLRRYRSFFERLLAA
jgi:hypothetical protein